jgi:hypothetical protein
MELVTRNQRRLPHRRGSVFMLAAIIAALSMATPVPARGALPELGRCVKVTPGTGEYKGSHCLVVAGGTGKYNWLPGPGAQNKFTSVLRAAFSAPVLELTGSKTQIFCFAAGKAEGEYTGPKTLIVKKLVLRSCHNPALEGLEHSKCQNVGSPAGEISAQELTGELGFIKAAKGPRVGVDLKPARGSDLALFECGGAVGPFGQEKGTGTGTNYALEGSVIGRIPSTGQLKRDGEEVTVSEFNKMALGSIVKYEVKEGRQVPEFFQGEAKDTLITSIVGTQTVEPTTFADVEEVKNEEPLEIKAKV